MDHGPEFFASHCCDYHTIGLEDGPTPRALAAARLTMGVSSWHNALKPARNSFCVDSVECAYGAAYSAQADVRDVNQSPPDRRLSAGM